MPILRAVRIDGKKLRRVRRRRLMSREELAQRAEMHRDSIGRLERDEVDTPRIGTIRTLAGILEVEPDEILADEDAD